MKKKLLAIVLVVFAIHTGVWAQETSGYCGDPNVNEGKDVAWELKVEEWGDSILVISGTGAMEDYLEEEFQTRPWNSMAKSITRIEISDGVTSVGSFAFALFESLERVESGNLERVGEGAFALCAKLGFCIPAYAAKRIEPMAFAECSALVGDCAEWQDCYGSVSIEASYIGSDAFAGCTSIKELCFVCFDMWGETVEEELVIDEGAFIACKSLEAVAIRDKGTVSIGRRAFAYCSNLDSVVCLVETPPTLGEDVFENIHPDAELVFENNEEFAKNAERRIAYITSDWAKYFELPTTIDEGYCGDEDVNGGKDVTWKMDVTGTNEKGEPALQLTIGGTGAMNDYIRYGAYSNNAKTTPWGGTLNLADSTLYMRELIASIIIEEGVTHVGKYAFGLKRESHGNACLNLTSVKFPNTLVEIGYGAFEHCLSLTSVEIPEGVKVIDGSSFSECPFLASVTLPSTLDSIGPNAFGYSFLEKIVIPDGVDKIGSGVFFGCSNLKNVVFPASLTTIPACMFYSCESLTEITIPNTVTSIGTWAFSGCENLSSVTCLNPVPPVVSSDSFRSISPTAVLWVPDESVEVYKASDWARYFSEIIGIDIEAINEVKTDQNFPATPIYNLQGVQMKNTDNLPSGIYIQNGKKFVVN